MQKPNPETTALRRFEEVRVSRFVGEDNYERLCEAARNDMHIQQLIGGLHHCQSPEAAIHLLVQAALVMAQANEHMRKIATDALMLQPKPPLILKEQPQ